MITIKRVIVIGCPGAGKRVGMPREDMPWVEQELDEEFKARILNFSNEALPEIYRLFEQYRNKVNIVIFKSRQDSDLFLADMDFNRNKILK